MKMILTFGLVLFSLITLPTYAESIDNNVAVVEFEEGTDYAKLDDSIFCSVGLVNRAASSFVDTMDGEVFEPLAVRPP